MVEPLHQAGAARRLLRDEELVEFILQPRDLCSTDLCLLGLTVLWITDSWMYSGLLVRIATLPLLPASSRSVYFSPMFCLLVHPRVITQCVLDIEVWK